MSQVVLFEYAADVNRLLGKGLFQVYFVGFDLEAGRYRLEEVKLFPPRLTLRHQNRPFGLWVWSLRLLFLRVFLQALSKLDQKVTSDSLLLLADHSHSGVFFQVPPENFSGRKRQSPRFRAKVAAVYVFGNHIDPIVDRVQNLPFLRVPKFDFAVYSD